MDLSGKSAIITGSTSGIGLGIARALAGAGADIMLNSIAEARFTEELRSSIVREFRVAVAFNDADVSRSGQ
jgi:3-hydroxybutyrate dehydrogenase